ncbi:hypothetical protein ARMSODRAFT_969061 [Armillaria solidipes]|uniref:Uncharacterized protein n=1 Tax=Armillaria solidipes TaxID=1076256 RepID=A0A2H3CAQ1_9AGAR|nr:hypothetical protein ARMSODRAFT_969061 [Armillaria solidipes]
MAAHAEIPADLTADDIAFISHVLDLELNSSIFYSLLTGIYTGVIAVTFWNIFTNKSQSNSRVVFTVIILLYLLTLIDFAFNWSQLCSGFIDQGMNLWTIYQWFSYPHRITTVPEGVVSGICTVFADSTLDVDLALLDGLGTTLANAGSDPEFTLQMQRDSALYACFTLAATLWYNGMLFYSDVVAGIARGIAPIFLFECIAAGHARPNEVWEGSVISSLRFGSHSSDQTQSDSEGDIMTSVIADNDLEAQLDERVLVGHSQIAGSLEDLT